MTEENCGVVSLWSNWKDTRRPHT